MNSFIIYSLETAVCLFLFYTVYWVFLKKETFFKLNRFYLLLSVFISLLLPLLNINPAKHIGKDSFLSTYLILPIVEYEERFSANIENELIPAGSGRNRLKNIGYLYGSSASQAEETNTMKPATTQGSSQHSAEDSDASKNINWLTLALLVYFTGAAFLFIRFLANFIWIFSFVLKYKPQHLFGMKVVRSEKNISPFSFLNFIFIGHNVDQEAELSKIISHEKVHIQQKHSIDLILFELLLSFQWFNPIVWFYKRDIRITHEYLADLGTLKSGVDLPGYQYSLLNQALSEHNFEIASTYNLSLKKRIAMMTKKRSSKLSALKLMIALPIFIMLLSAFSFGADNNIIPVETTKLSGIHDTSIKKVDVTVAYLKLLEGEYVSTNDVRGERRIIFSELLGTLFGNDNGYTYKIIPVGGEKFINPDDKASLVFNSKDENAISLLLFGKINLNKVKLVAGSGHVQNRSMAFTLANVMLKDGIPAGLAYHKLAKDSGNYFLTEIDMSYAGFQLMEKGKTKEAVALLKLDTEVNASSFNAYDSYGEALLANGETSLAIEAFKESVKLNPGSKNGLKRLKELGVNTDKLVKPVKIPLSELKLLEGVYLSTDQPHWIRKITFTSAEGVLAGEDNGYHYKLIAMGEGKFINPDDGESLVFDTKDKSAIKLLLFGTIHLNKIKSADGPDTDLKEYAGLYLPDIKYGSPILGPMEIIHENNNKLVRFLPSEPAGSANRTLELQFVTNHLFFYPDNSNRSIEFVLNDKREVTGCILRRWDGTFTLTKKK